MAQDEAAGIVAWTLVAGLEGIGQEALLAGFCARLAAAGVPLWRVAIGADTLHPLLGAQGHTWVEGEGVRAEVYERAREDTASFAEWQQSPWYHLLESGTFALRRRLERGEGVGAFPLLASLAARGATDYLARLVPFGTRESLGETRGVATSFTTRRPGGFAPSDLARIEASLPALALAFKASLAVAAARTLVTTYLGRAAAARILKGEIVRGQVTTVRRVLWLCDLVGFTRIADTVPRECLLDLLDAYADGLVGVVHEHEGEVLKFMGDGFLAVFAGPPEEACRRALDAAEAATRVIARLNRERAAAGLPVTGFTLALHEGEVLYGNVGSRDRLDFTVVGPAVNLVARIQAMSRALDQPVLISAEFAAVAGPARARLVPLGRYALRGVARPQELLTLDPGDGAAQG